MKLTDYIIDRLFSVVMFLVAVIFSMGLLWLMGLRYEFIIYIEIIFGFSFLAALLWDYTRKKKYYCGFMALFDGLDDKTLLAELIEKPGFLDGKLLYQILRLSNKYMNDKLAEAGATNQEYREYIEMWVHEIKNADNLCPFNH